MELHLEGGGLVLHPDAVHEAATDRPLVRLQHHDVLFVVGEVNLEIEMFSLKFVNGTKNRNIFSLKFVNGTKIEICSLCSW